MIFTYSSKKFALLVSLILCIVSCLVISVRADSLNDQRPGNLPIYDEIDNDNPESEHPIARSVKSGSCGDNVTWRYNNGVLTITGTGEMDDYDDESDEEDGPGWYVYRRQIKTVIINKGITHIGNFSLRDCNTTSLTIPNSVTSIGHGAFAANTGLTAVSIPSSVQTIGGEAFQRCSGLTDVFIPKSVTMIYGAAFDRCENVTILCYDGSKAHTYARKYDIPYKLIVSLDQFDFKTPVRLKTVENEAFTGIKAKRVRLAESVTKIGSRAFANCPKLVCIYIPYDCTNIPANAFSGVDNLTIYGHDGSYAEFYAEKYHYGFVNVDLIN